MLFTQDTAFIAHLLQSSYFSNVAGSRLITNLKPQVKYRVYCLLHPEDYGCKVGDTNKEKEEDDEEEDEGEDLTKKNKRKKKRKITKTRWKRTPKMRKGTIYNGFKPIPLNI